MSIVCQGLSKSYGGHPVVQDVSLEIADGEFFVLLGPSGSGKSTVLRMIAGLSDADSGRVFLHGRDVTDLPPPKRGVGFVFQNYALFRHMTVGENIEFGLEVRGVAREERRRRREELLDMVGLGGFGQRMPRELSGGQQQRIALARALAHSPEVLLLDEPFGALDLKIRVELRRTVKTIQRETGVTAIFVTHDQEEAFEVADRVGILDRGKLLEVGPPEELYLRPGCEFAAGFLGSANLFVGQSGREGLRLGPVVFPLATKAPSDEPSARVQVLFRPEDVAVKDTPDALSWPLLGKAVVEQTSFYGSFERLRLRLPDLTGIRSIAPQAAFGSEGLVVDASRSTHQARRFPLRPGDSAWVGVRRVHALPHPGLNVLVALDGELASMEAVRYASRLATLAQARVTLLGASEPGGVSANRLDQARSIFGAIHGGLETRFVPGTLENAVAAEADREPFDLVIAGRPKENISEWAGKLLAAGRASLLFVPRASRAPERVLICVARGEPGKSDVLFAGRLLRHVQAEATLFMAVAPEDTESEPRWAERFLDAGVKSLANFGVRSKTRIVHGSPADAVVAEAGSEGYGLVVVGAPLAAPDGTVAVRGVVAALLESESCPAALIVQGVS